jgi:hypothetical protein
LNAVLTESLALLVAMVFSIAAISKLTAWRELPGVVQNFRVLPRALALPAAFALPPLEIAIAVGTLFERTRSLAAIAAAILFLVFGAALAINLHRGRRQIDCGCFRSDLRQPISVAVILRNLILTVCALLLLSADGEASTLSPFAWAIAIGGAATLFLCYLSIGVIFRPPPPSYEDNFHADRRIPN